MRRSRVGSPRNLKPMRCSWFGTARMNLANPLRYSILSMKQLEVPDLQARVRNPARTARLHEVDEHIYMQNCKNGCLQKQMMGIKPIAALANDFCITVLI